MGILVADVTGHGVPAALIASMLKVALSAQSAGAADPAAVLTGLNQALCGKFEDHFVTAAYLFIDLEKQILRYAGAGHPPVFFAERAPGESALRQQTAKQLREDELGKGDLPEGNFCQEVREIEENGLCLGMFPEAIYSTTEWPYRPCDACLLYTDGLLEATNAQQEEFGKVRCKQFLHTHATEPASLLAENLIAVLAEWSSANRSPKQSSHLRNQSNTPQNQYDDITLVAIKFTSP